MGRAAQARSIVTTNLKKEPNALDALGLLGEIEYREGNHEKAIEWFRKVLSRDPNQWRIHYRLGQAYQNLGKHEAAIAQYRSIPADCADPADIHFRIGLAFEGLERLDEALLAYQRVLHLRKDDPDILDRIGNIYKKQGHLEAARKAFKRAIALAPDFARAINNLGTLYKKMGQPEIAARHYERALAIDPELAEALCNLGNIHKNLGNDAAAQDYYRRALRVRPDFWEAHYGLGEINRARLELTKALSAFKRAITADPTMVQAYHKIGNILMHQGRSSDALKYFCQAVKIKPDFVEAYRNIAVLRRFTEPDSMVRKMEALLQAPHLGGGQKSQLNFALGKAYEDMQAYDRAFGYLAEGNRLKRDSFEYDQRQTIALFDQIQNVFSKRLFSTMPSAGFRAEVAPIFIVGMPRSGTSLVEQILSHHPDVYAAGELSNLDRILTSLGKKVYARKFPLFVQDMGSDDLYATGEMYISMLDGISERANHRFITDKMPFNFMFIGMISLILPDAKVVHCQRDPMDTCLSIFKNLFALLHPFAYDLDELGTYYRHYADMMAHWYTMLPGYIYDLQYESLVSDPKNQVRRLLQFCSLPWRDSCLKFHESFRPVFTASTAQVRRPIYTDSVGLWEKYAPHLELLREKIQREKI
jgi:tetratricopeptide (TPR) repeat protein